MRKSEDAQTKLRQRASDERLMDKNVKAKTCRCDNA